MRVHQMTATFVSGDAIGNDILEIDRRLKAWGFDARIYAENIEPGMVRLCRPDVEYSAFCDSTEDLLIYHYSVYAANLTQYERSRNRKIVIYHNITPPAYFSAYDPALADLCRLGRDALPRLQGCDAACGDSDLNRRELVSAGIPAELTGVLPIFLALDQYETAGRNPALFDRLRREGETNLLYVGRLAPNKACEDLIKIACGYRKFVNPRAHLWLVGAKTPPSYHRCLEALVDRLQMRSAVTFTGKVSSRDLYTFYQAADVFLYASRHEGFGVPLLESMAFGVPILAYAAAAVPETLGSSAVLYHRFAYPEIAEMIDLLATESAFRRQIIRGQRQRLDDFRPEVVEQKLREVLEDVGAL